MLDNEKPIKQFLTLKEQMEVTLLVSDNVGIQCVGIGVIDECSPRGVWCGFRVLHSFFVVVNITKVNTEYNGQTVYCKEESITTLGSAINHRVLWSGYKVRPTEPLCPSGDAVVKEECIGGPPICFQPDMEDKSCSDSDINTTASTDELGGHCVGAQVKADQGDAESANAYPDRPLWKGRICNLLNDDRAFFGKAKIVVCLSNKPFDEENLKGTDAGVLFFSDGDL